MPENPPRVWVLADPRAGTRNQTLAVAEALDTPFQVKDIAYTGWSMLPNWLRGASAIGIAESSLHDMPPPWPDVVISAGRRLVPLARHIYHASQGKTFLCHLMYPGKTGLQDFKIVVVPAHDALRNVRLPLIEVLGTPHRLTPVKLEEAAQQWRIIFEEFPKPWTAVLLGGGQKGKPLALSLAQKYADDVLKLTQGKGTILITNSRRTGKEATDLIFEEISRAQPAFTYRVENGGENPYLGFLALAERLVVSGDSMSMCTEAAGTLEKMFIFAPPGLVSKKHARLHKELYARGYAAPLESPENLPEKPPSFPLNPAKEIADKIKEMCPIFT